MPSVHWSTCIYNFLQHLYQFRYFGLGTNIFSTKGMSAPFWNGTLTLFLVYLVPGTWVYHIIQQEGDTWISIGMERVRTTVHIATPLYIHLQAGSRKNPTFIARQMSTFIDSDRGIFHPCPMRPCEDPTCCGCCCRCRCRFGCFLPGFSSVRFFGKYGPL